MDGVAGGAFFSKALNLIYLMLNEDVLVDRQYSHGAALTLRAYWASPLSERAAIAKAAGLQLVAENDVPIGEQHWPYSDIFFLSKCVRSLARIRACRFERKILRHCGLMRPV